MAIMVRSLDLNGFLLKKWDLLKFLTMESVDYSDKQGHCIWKEMLNLSNVFSHSIVSVQNSHYRDMCASIVSTCLIFSIICIV